MNDTERLKKVQKILEELDHSKESVLARELRSLLANRSSSDSDDNDEDGQHEVWPDTWDASLWADAFCEKNKIADRTSILSWFALAIRNGYDAGVRDANNARIEAETEASCQSIMEAYTTLKLAASRMVRMLDNVASDQSVLLATLEQVEHDIARADKLRYPLRRLNVKQPNSQ